MKSIQDIINNKLSNEQEERKTRKRSGKFSPSLFGCCYRRQYWNRADEPQSNPTDARSLRIFAVGNQFHNWIENLICNEEPNIQKEVKIETDDILGFADLVSDNEVMDIKTQHSKAFWHLEGKDIAKEKYQNWLQVLWYAWRLNKEKARLVLVSKDDLTINEYEQPLNEYWKGELDMELTKLDYYWKQKKVPPAMARAYNGKECSYCAWKDKCSQLEKGVKNAVVK